MQKKSKKHKKGRVRTAFRTDAQITIHQDSLMAVDRRDLVWLPDLSQFIDIGAYALFLLPISEAVSCLGQSATASSNLNIDLAYCLVLCVGFMALYKPLLILWKAGMGSGSASEGQLSIFIGIAAFLLALLALQMPYTLLDNRLSLVVPPFIERTRAFVSNITGGEDDRLTKNSAIVPSLTSFNVFVAVCCALISISMVQPAIRYTHEYNDVIKTRSRSGAAAKVVAHVVFLFPIFLSLLWVPFLSGDFFLSNNLVACNKNATLRDCHINVEDSTSSSQGAVITESKWHTLRLALVIVYTLLRALAFRSHLQAYLDNTLLALEDARRQPNSAKLNTRVLALKLISYGRSVCIAATQYFSPLTLSCSLALMLRWTTSSDIGLCHAARSVVSSAGLDNFTAYRSSSANNSTIQLLPGYVQEIRSSFSDVFGADLHRWFWNFLLWWSLATWAFLSSLFYIYRRNVAQQQGDWWKGVLKVD